MYPFYGPFYPSGFDLFRMCPRCSQSTMFYQGGGGRLTCSHCGFSYRDELIAREPVDLLAPLRAIVKWIKAKVIRKSTQQVKK